MSAQEKPATCWICNRELENEICPHCGPPEPTGLTEAEERELEEQRRLTYFAKGKRR
jgi:hypothetical protein